MFARGFRSRFAAFVLIAAVSVVAVLAPAWGAGPHQKKPVSLTSTMRAEYRIMQNENEMGREAVEKKVFDNNTVLFTVDGLMRYGPGVSMKQHVELTVEEESYSPRSLRVLKTITQPDSQFFEHQIDVDMYSNVAVVSTRLRDRTDQRRIVVPTGVAIADLGVISYLYQMLFWYDREVGGGQRFQFLDPIGGAVNGGEIKLDGEETITVLGKKLKTSVFKLERDKFGAATLWVDKQGTIVRGEQNLFIFELVSKKGS